MWRREAYSAGWFDRKERTNDLCSFGVFVRYGCNEVLGRARSYHCYCAAAEPPARHSCAETAFVPESDLDGRVEFRAGHFVKVSERFMRLYHQRAKSRRISRPKA